jgi:hypothetical protein
VGVEIDPNVVVLVLVIIGGGVKGRGFNAEAENDYHGLAVEAATREKRREKIDLR